jgi:hypothetical protein
MTLHQFLDVVADTPAESLRLAMTHALLTEVPRNPVDYESFYRRVLAGLESRHANRPAA